MKYSLIVPVYNRPDEVDELLESLCGQTVKAFEVIIVEDGSTRDCRAVVEKYQDRLDVKYFAKPNSGPGQSRNYGAERAQGEYLIVLDSDVVLPRAYIKEVSRELEQAPTEAFGGPDRAHDSFTPVQKAISYSMTSFFTTGGIRGGKKKLDKFFPRSFNMGIRRDVYKQLGGFSKMRFGEDIDCSCRIVEAGYSPRGMGMAQAAHGFPKVLPTSVQQRHRPHQSGKAPSWNDEACAPSADGVYRGSHRLGTLFCRRKGIDALLPGAFPNMVSHGCPALAAHFALLARHFHRFRPTEPLSPGGSAQCTRCFRSAYGLRLWILGSMVETLCAEARCLHRLREEFL